MDQYMLKDYRLVLIIFALVITTISFLPFLNNGFFNWDDYAVVKKNQLTRELSLTNLKKIFTSYQIGTYIPITILSFALEYKYFKLDPKVYHCTNTPHTYYNRGVFYYNVGEINKALIEFNEALKINPCYPEAYYERSKTYYQLGEQEKAKNDLITAKKNGL